MSTGGLVTSGSATGHWAWVGVRLTPAPAAGDSGVFPDVEEPARRAEAARAERAWLAGRWSTEHGVRWQLRYTGGAGQPVSCLLLGRVHGRDAAVVADAAGRLRDRLAEPPRHVRAAPITDPAELGAALAAPVFGPGGACQVGKDVRWQWCSRPDVARRVYTSVRPFDRTGTSWEPVWSALARLAAPTTVAVHLEPHRAGPAAADRLRTLAAEYGRLARPVANPVWLTEPDRFAVDAAPGHLDAAHRYLAEVFRLRVSIVSAAPLDRVFAHAVAATIGGVVRPVGDAELDTLRRNLGALNDDPLGRPFPDEVTAELVAADLADLAEARAAFPFPFEAPDRPPLFRDRPGPAPADPRAARTGRRVFVSYVQEDLAEVERLVDALNAAGHDVWMDRRSLRAGQRWQQVIAQQIRSGDHFIACFSPAACAKAETYMREELIGAIERMRRMARDRIWLIPIRFGECRLPDYPIGPGEFLDDLQAVDFRPGEDNAEPLRRLLAALGPADAPGA